MIKKYISDSCIAVNISLGKLNKHISFDPITLGGSSYVTENKYIQNGLEKHPRFGELFTLEGKVEETKPEPEKPVNPEDLKEMQVPCIDDAKEYLADKYAISRTRMKSTESIQRMAAEYGFKFVGPDFE